MLREGGGTSGHEVHVGLNGAHEDDEQGRGEDERAQNEQRR